MILHEFPDLQWLKAKAETGFSGNNNQKGWPSVVLNVRSNGCYRDDIRGPLTLFTNIAGVSNVVVNGKSTSVSKDFYFITNSDQYYTLDIEPGKETETFNVHLGAHFMEGIWEAWTNPSEYLLENKMQHQERICFYNRLRPKNQSLNFMLSELANGPAAGNLLLEEQLTAVAIFLLEDERKLHETEANLPAIKHTTRTELMKRILIAVDFIYSEYHRDLTLDELASACCMSKFHFLRLFRIAMQKTPGQLLDEIRIDRAKEILRIGKADVKLIAQKLGYRNASSFSRMFKKQTGVYPTQYR